MSELFYFLDTVFLAAHLLRQKQKELKRLENLSVLDFDKEVTPSLQDISCSYRNSNNGKNNVSPRADLKVINS